MTKNPIYFIFGEEDFLIEEKIKAITNQFPHYSKEYFEAKVDLERLFLTVSSTSLFSKAKIIYCKNPSFLLENLTSEQWLLLEKIFSLVQTGQDILIIYLQDKSFDQRKKIALFLKKNCNYLEFNSFKDWEQDKVRLWIKNRIEEKGLTANPEAINLLEEFGQNNLRQLASEIDKLGVYLGLKKQLTSQDVQMMFSGTSKSIFDFQEALKLKKTDQLLEIGQYLLDYGDDPVKLLGLVVSNLRLYLQLLVLVKNKISLAEIAKKLGKNPYFLSKLIPIIQKSYSIERLIYGFNTFSKLDFEIKSGLISPKLGFELALFALSN